MTSDAFFAQNEQLFDVIFVDGLHEAAQVWKDVQAALKVLSPNGLIFMHDCNPRTLEIQIVPRQNILWTGDVWKVAVALRNENGFEMVVGDFDHGVGLIRKTPNEYKLPNHLQSKLVAAGNPLLAFEYNEFNEYRETMIRLKSFFEVQVWLEYMAEELGI